ncbi:hypothetical protein [Aporhodopirellula aestuarii]|nr:hypothetical protein [Aporhodopirellula aestuarii]
MIWSRSVRGNPLADMGGVVDVLTMWPESYLLDGTSEDGHR